MRTIALVLVAVSLLAIVPAVDASGPGGSCQVREEYVTEATIGDPSTPEQLVEPGYYTPLECYY